MAAQAQACHLCTIGVTRVWQGSPSVNHYVSEVDFDIKDDDDDDDDPV